MSKTLREKGSKGVFWSVIDNAGNYGVQFIVGIVLARILSPAEFGLVGLITVVVMLMTPFIDSGFSTALIRKNNCTQSDYSTVFIFNIIVSIFIYFVVFLCSPIVSSFYNEPQLINLLRVLAFVIVIDSFGLIQQTILIKNIDFKTQSFISIISSTISGGVSIVLAYKGFGVWSLVYRSLLNSFIKSLLLWVFNKWTPSFVFNIKAFKDFFAFGSKLLLANFINQLQKQFSYIVIGKFYSPTDLGFFTRAGQFQQLPTALLMSTFGKVSMPLLAEIKDNDQRLRVSFSKLLQTVMFASIPIILLMAAVAKPMIVLLIGEKWLPSVIYLQLMCFSGLWYPMHVINLNILQLKGESGLFLKLEISKKIINVLIIGTAIIWDIQTMLGIAVVNSLFLTFLNSYFSKRLINFSFLEQINSIKTIVFYGIIMFLSVYFLNNLVFYNVVPLFRLPILIGFGVGIYFGLSYIFSPVLLREFYSMVKLLLVKKK